MINQEILSSHDALCLELDEIQCRRNRRPRAGDRQVIPDDLESFEQKASRLEISALCLSGGGIRSASFCLGVLQSLAESKMIQCFDYLSTVSGGGFIGGWLQLLIRDSGGVATAQEVIAKKNPEALRRLRAYTNYLTPQTGALSIDTWTGAVLYLRNLIINWAIFTPLFLLLTLIPISYKTIIWACRDLTWINLFLFMIGCAALLIGIVQVCSLLPSHRPQEPKGEPQYASAQSIFQAVVYPVLGWAFLIPSFLELASDHSPDRPPFGGEWDWIASHHHWVIPATYLILVISGFSIAWWYQSYRKDPSLALFRANFGRWILASIGASMLIWLTLLMVFQVFNNKIILRENIAATLTIVAPLMFAVTHVLQTSLYVALRCESDLADLDREWLGRVNAMILRLILAWTIFAVACLVVSEWIAIIPTAGESGTDRWGGGQLSLLALATAALGGGTAWLGKIWSGLEDLVHEPSVWDRVRAHLPAILGVVAVALMMIFFGTITNFTLANLQLVAASVFALGLDPKVHPVWLPLSIQAGLALVSIAGILTFRGVNVNRFSMHAVYRNRLTRAFLGSARAMRKPDPFTGFDPHDNVPLASLLNISSSLFPVINTTLNITATTNTAWAERKAASFPTTPLYCGSSALRHPAQDALSPPIGAFVPTKRFAALEDLQQETGAVPEIGPGLGSALTISGAAVSPNWGYHSSRITSFLMTLFNVRLGCWLPNPSKATPAELQLARPRNSLVALINELLGETTDDNQAIYLSDGGHFDNLGIYEMIRRRCKLILAIDAGADENCFTADLGSVIRKAEIDLGASIEMTRPIRLCSRAHLQEDKTLGKTALAFAYGKITYNGGESGQLVYIKPSFLEGSPADVRAYAFENVAFPHESTADQWFSESQFDSYRKLGHHQMAELLKGVEPSRLDQLFSLAAARAKPEDMASFDGCDGIRALAAAMATRVAVAANNDRKDAAE